MSAGHPDRSHSAPTALCRDRFAWEATETVAPPGDAVATLPRRYTGCIDHRKQLSASGFPWFVLWRPASRGGYEGLRVTLCRIARHSQ